MSETLSNLESNVLLFNEDCIDSMSKLRSESVELILTDPPYNLGLFMKDRDTNLKKMRDNFFGAAGWDDLGFADWEASMNNFFAESTRLLKKGGAMIVFMSVIKVETLIRLAEQNGLYYKTTGIWHKHNPMPRNMNLHFVNSTEAWVYFTYKKKTGTFNNAGKAVHDFFETSVTPGTERRFGKHPTQKPEQLLQQFIHLLSNEGETVLDPFMGSGSTGVVAKRNRRKFIGIELNKEYFQNATERIKETKVYET
ncbi:site-specific DNA-methyltransferase [Paenibacillus sp. FSL F4-0125]|uniref:DNA-methyltransferase n=1 Tax=Paenibacillus sp. FSL F4-0125 TaxID=2954730 RepID=UPI0030F4B528